MRSWVGLSSSALLVSSGKLSGRCPALFSSRVRSISVAPSHDDVVHAVLVVASEKMLIGDGLGPEPRRRSLVWKVDSLLRSLSVILQHSEPYNRVGSTQLWYSLSLVLVLYWDDFHTLFNMLKVFLALFRRFLRGVAMKGYQGFRNSLSNTSILHFVYFYSDLTAILITDKTCFGDLEPNPPHLLLKMLATPLFLLSLLSPP